MELCDRSWEGIFSLELHLAIGVAQLLVRPADSSAGWSLSLTAIEAYGSCQVAALGITRGSENDKAHQYANGSILESLAAASRNAPVSRRRESTQHTIHTVCAGVPYHSHTCATRRS